MSAGTCPICSTGQSLSLALSTIRGFRVSRSLHVCVSPVQQIGPSCGIAALSSAMTAFEGKVHTSLPNFQKLLASAKHSSITFAGEMFDAKNIVKLLETESDLRAEIVNLSDDLRKARVVVLNCLSQQKPVLIAYDCDADFFPRRCNGRKAHWAVLNGYCVCSDSKTSQETKLMHIDLDEDAISALCHDGSDSPDNAVYFWTLQGKSKLFRLFNASDLLESNFQLREADPKLLPLGFKVPSDGNITDGLSSKIIVLSLP